MKLITQYLNEALIKKDTKIKHNWTIKDAQEGDIIMVCIKKNLHKMLFIFKCIFHTTEVGDVVGIHACYSCNTDIIEVLNKNSKNYIGEVDEYIKGTYKNRLATDKEKELFFNKLNKEGYKWNPNKKEIENI